MREEFESRQYVFLTSFHQATQGNTHVIYRILKKLVNQQLTSNAFMLYFGEKPLRSPKSSSSGPSVLPVPWQDSVLEHLKEYEHLFQSGISAEEAEVKEGILNVDEADDGINLSELLKAP